MATSKSSASSRCRASISSPATVALWPSSARPFWMNSAVSAIVFSDEDPHAGRVLSSLVVINLALGLVLDDLAGAAVNFDLLDVALLLDVEGPTPACALEFIFGVGDFAGASLRAIAWACAFEILGTGGLAAIAALLVATIAARAMRLNWIRMTILPDGWECWRPSGRHLRPRLPKLYEFTMSERGMGRRVGLRCCRFASTL